MPIGYAACVTVLCRYASPVTTPPPKEAASLGTRIAPDYVNPNGLSPSRKISCAET